jgi:hypothetical protein
MYILVAKKRMAMERPTFGQNKRSHVEKSSQVHRTAGDAIRET